MALGKNMKVDRLIPAVPPSPKEPEKVMESAALDLNLDSLEEQVEQTNEDAVVPAVVDSLPEVLLENEVLASSAQAIADEMPSVTEASSTPAATLYEDVEEEGIQIHFKPSRRKTQKRILIDIEGSLTIQHVELLYSKVSDVFENYDFVEVSMKNVTEIDLTVVQLFHAIRVSFYPMGKYISINAEFSRDDRKLLNTCGFTEFQTQNTAT